MVVLVVLVVYSCSARKVAHPALKDSSVNKIRAFPLCPNITTTALLELARKKINV